MDMFAEHAAAQRKAARDFERAMSGPRDYYFPEGAPMGDERPRRARKNPQPKKVVQRKRRATAPKAIREATTPKEPKKAEPIKTESSATDQSRED